MVAVINPRDSDLRGEVVFLDLAPATETVAGALHDEGRSPQRFQMFEPRARRLAGRMERIAEADQATDPSLICHHTGDPPAERFPADYKLPASAQRLNYLPPCIKQHRLTIGRA